ncbi:MAG: hypothetical protein K2Q20_03360 [Phycisphaerales bacterium]|nr:hypothetical protein [Phycisphaerales bacterium]
MPEWNRWIGSQRVLMAGFALLTAGMVGGCMSRMDMPPRALLVTMGTAPEPSAERWRVIDTLQDVDGRKDFLVWKVDSSPDGSLLVLSMNVYWDPLPTEPAALAERRGSDSGVLIWAPGSGEAGVWISLPDEGDGWDPNARALAFSSEHGLIAVHRGGRVVIWSSITKRIVSTFRCELGRMALRRAESGERARVTRSIRTARFSDDGARLLIEFEPGGWESWRVADGTAEGRASGLARSTAPSVRWDDDEDELRGLEGLGFGKYISSNRRPARTSPDGRHTAIAFMGGVYFLGTGDATPRHMRVWERSERSLVLWIEASKWWSDARSPIEFLNERNECLILGSGTLSWVDLAERREVAMLRDLNFEGWVRSRGWLVATRRGAGIVVGEVVGVDRLGSDGGGE